MKKIIIAIVALFISMVANAQISADYRTFTLGDYVFASYSWDVKAGEGGKYSIILNAEEAMTVRRFILTHENEIADKLGVVIANCERKLGELDVWVYENDYYENMSEMRRREKERLENERQARLSSLGELLK